jgi:hypothetical protein
LKGKDIWADQKKTNVPGNEGYKRGRKELEEIGKEKLLKK